MELTKEDWSAWKAHPCTKAMSEIVTAAIIEAKDAPRGRDSAEDTVRNAHYVDGWCVGAGEIQTIMEEITDED